MTSVNTDSEKLAKRIEAHNKYSQKDINEWIFDIIKLKENEDILDIGCGTGKQLIPMTEKTCGLIVGVDISEDSINSIKADLGNNHENVKLITGSMESLEENIKDQKFDLIISCFAIYYVEDREGILLTLKSMLKENGRLFLCGPSLNNNQALLNIHSKIAPLPKMKKGYFEKFAIPFLKENFSKIEEFTFQNSIEFPDVDSLVEYWLSYAIGDKNKVEEFKAAAETEFKDGKFTTTKEVIGVLAYK